MWSSRGIVALVLGLTIFFTFALEAIHQLLYSRGESPEYVVEAWKEILLILIGGLMAWLGGQDKNQ